MLENLSREDLFPYLFKAKRWTGGKSIFKVWSDMLEEFSDDILKYVIVRALGTDGHIDGSILREWAKIQNDTISKKYIKHEPMHFVGFCHWCLEDRPYDTTYETYYCKVCSCYYSEEKSMKAKELLKNGKIDFVKKCRDIILNKVFDFEALEVYKNKMVQFKEKTECYKYLI